MSDPQHLTPGSVFAGDFRVVERLSEGGMGAVYVADQVSTGARRALKLMHPDLVTNARLRERFRLEARIGARIDSDHVVQVVGAGIDEQSQVPWLAMELLQGADLARHVERRGRLQLSEMLEVYSQLAHALGAAHAQGIVHRDLKPENIFLASPRRPMVPFTVKILDFGIAKLVAEADTKRTAALGTPLWMAPEQTTHDGGISPATDVWALGLISFFVLTGRYFWRGANVEAASAAMLLREIVMDEIPAASRRARELGIDVPLPPWFDGWFGRSVQRQPASRFQDARTMFDALSAIVPTGSPNAPPSDSRRSSPGRPPVPIVAPTLTDPGLALAAASAPFQSVNAPTRGSVSRRRGRWLIASALVSAATVLAAWLVIRAAPDRPSDLTRTTGGLLAEHEVTVSGTIPVAEAERTVMASASRLRACYETALRGDPHLKGNVIVQVDVDETGEALGGSIVGTTFANSAVASCIVGVLYDLKFQAPVSGKATVTVTLTFSPIGTSG